MRAVVTGKLPFLVSILGLLRAGAADDGKPGAILVGGDFDVVDEST